jgi:hypothetical protein
MCGDIISIKQSTAIELAKGLVSENVRVLSDNQFVANELTDEQKAVVYNRIIHCSKYGVMEVINAVIAEMKKVQL